MTKTQKRHERLNIYLRHRNGKAIFEITKTYAYFFKFKVAEFSSYSSAIGYIILKMETFIWGMKMTDFEKVLAMLETTLDYCQFSIKKTFNNNELTALQIKVSDRFLSFSPESFELISC